MCKVRGCEKCYTHPSSLRKHMKLHCKADSAKLGEDGEPGSPEVTGEQVPSSPAAVTRTLPPAPSQDSPETLRSRYHHTFDSTLDYTAHRPQTLLDPLLLHRGSYRGQTTQYACSQASPTFASSHGNFPSNSHFQKSFVNGWYTCHSGAQPFSSKPCNND